MRSTASGPRQDVGGNSRSAVKERRVQDSCEGPHHEALLGLDGPDVGHGGEAAREGQALGAHGEGGVLAKMVQQVLVVNVLLAAAHGVPGLLPVPHKPLRVQQVRWQPRRVHPVKAPHPLSSPQMTTTCCSGWVLWPNWMDWQCCST